MKDIDLVALLKVVGPVLVALGGGVVTGTSVQRSADMPQRVEAGMAFTSLANSCGVSLAVMQERIDELKEQVDACAEGE